MRSSASARAISAEEGPSLLHVQSPAVEDGKAATQDLVYVTFFEVFYSSLFPGPDLAPKC